ncbi:MAG: hypothetical protein AB7F88_00130 [Pyrinomonadaceae bacterium]
MKHFLTGGTTGPSKIVSHSLSEWREMILDTALVLEELGVTEASRVLIGQPSFPWGIGQVFADACDGLGASTYCFGLHVKHEAIARQVPHFDLTHVTLPPGLLLNWIERGCPVPQNVNVWIVGEALSMENQRRIEDHWQPRSIRRIYGCSEFGTLAFQGADEELWMRTNPRFNFRIDESNTSAGIGRLSVERAPDGEVFDTGDHVSLRKGENTGGIWSGAPEILFHRRISPSMILSDGSAISADVVEALKKEFGIAEIQIVRTVTPAGDELVVNCNAEHRGLDVERVKKELFRRVPGLDLETADEDSWNLCRVDVRDIEIRLFSRTERGKIPIFVN